MSTNNVISNAANKVTNDNKTSKSNEKYLVIGSSGTVGQEVVRILEEQGYSVRKTTSKKKNSPDEFKANKLNSVYLNLLTGEGIKEAFSGIDRAFLMVPTGYADQYKILAPLIDAAKENSLKKVVLMTAMGVDANDKGAYRRAELKLEGSGLHYQIVRPNWFMQNFNTFWVQGIRELGKILVPAGAAATSFIDTRDVSAVVAKLLTLNLENSVLDKQISNQKAFNLTGPQALTHDDVAIIMSEVLRKKITYESIEPSVLHQGLLAAGLQEDFCQFLLEILGYLKLGYNSSITSEVKNILGREPLDFHSYVAGAKNLFN